LQAFQIVGFSAISRNRQFPRSPCHYIKVADEFIYIPVMYF